MDRYAIHVMEATYGGYHGIEDYIIDEYENLAEVEIDAECRSRELMDDYRVSEDFYEAAESAGFVPDTLNTKVYDEVIACYLENIEYSIWKIKDDVIESDSFLENKFWQDPDEFVKKYCEEN